MITVLSGLDDGAGKEDSAGKEVCYFASRPGFKFNLAISDDEW